jgi:MoxR-like ATPase
MDWFNNRPKRERSPTMTFLSDTLLEAALSLPVFAGYEATVHRFDRRSIDAINTSLACGRPLLLRGEPGVGKSQLARAAAFALKRAFVAHVVDAHTESRDLFWRFDAVARLAKAQVQGALAQLNPQSAQDCEKELAEIRFVEPGPLWWAYDWPSALKQAREQHRHVPTLAPDCDAANGVVVLIDEVDKADASVPNGLLEALGAGSFACPYLGYSIERTAAKAPLIVLTTNEERALPDAFLRRCMVLTIEMPRESDELVMWLMERGRVHFTPKQCDDKVLKMAAEQLSSDRQVAQRRNLHAPGQAEYLDLIRALVRLADGDVGKQEELLKRIGQFALQKHPSDNKSTDHG